MLASKRSASLTPELNLWTLTNACKVDDPRADVTGYPKQGYQWPLKKNWCSTKMKEII